MKEKKPYPVQELQNVLHHGAVVWNAFIVQYMAHFLLADSEK